MAEKVVADLLPKKVGCGSAGLWHFYRIWNMYENGRYGSAWIRLWKEINDPPGGLRKVLPSAEWGEPRAVSKRDWTRGDHCCRRSVPE